MLCVWTRRHLHSPLTFSVHGVTMTGIEWSAAFKDAHLRVWRATIKQDYTKRGILLLKPLLMTSAGNSRGHLSNNLIFWQARNFNLCSQFSVLFKKTKTKKKPHELEIFKFESCNIIPCYWIRCVSRFACEAEMSFRSTVDFVKGRRADVFSPSPHWLAVLPMLRNKPINPLYH